MVHGTIGGMTTKTVAQYADDITSPIDSELPLPNNKQKYKKKITHYKDIITTGGAGRPKFKSELRKGKAFYSEGEGKGVNLSARKQTASSGVNDPDGVNLSTTKRITDSIAIYLPPNIQSDYGVQYGAHETGMLGFLAATVGASVGGIKNQNLEKAAQALVGGVEGFTQYALQKALSSAADFLTQSEGGEELFNKPDLREFTYNFTFVPRSEAETNDVNTIIQMFRFHMAPEMRQDHSRFMTLPSEFDLHYMYQDGNGVAAENSYFNKISTCVLKNCSVNYTPDGAVQTHDDGSPVKITMSLTFAETEMITKQKIQEGF